MTGTLRVRNSNSNNQVIIFSDTEGGTIEQTNANSNIGIHRDMFNGECRNFLYQLDPWKMLNCLNITSDSISSSTDFINGNGISLNGLNNDLGSMFTLLWSGSCQDGTTSLSVSGSKYTLFLVLYYIVGSTDGTNHYFSAVAYKNCTTRLTETIPDSKYYQTTYTRNITIKDTNFTTSKASYGRNGEFGEFNTVLIIEKIYGIK